MAVLNMSLASQALKRFYLPGIQVQLNESTPILAVMDRDKTSVSGEKVVMALRYGRQGGVGMRADDGNLPTPNSRKTKQAEWVTKNIFAQIQISDKTMKASRNNQGAFINLLTADLEDAMTDTKDSVSRQMFGDGTGKLAVTTVTAASTAVTVNTTQYLAEGMLVDVVNPSDGVVKHSEIEITAVNDITNVVTLQTAVTTDADDVLVAAGNWGSELTGFGAVFTPGNTLYNIDRNLFPFFNPTVKTLAGGGEEMSEILIQNMIDDCEKKVGGKVNFLSGSYGVRRAYQNLLLATKQIIQPMELKGGYNVLTYNGMPFTVDKYASSGTLYGLDMTTWKMYHMDDFQWLDDDGAILSRVAGKPVWSATLARYCDIGCNKPKGNFKLSNIIEH